MNYDGNATYATPRRTTGGSGITYLLAFVILIVIIGMGYYIMFKRIKLIPSEECPKCPTCPTCPECPKPSDPNERLVQQNDNLKDMVKYLSLIVRKNEAERELYKWNNNRHQVFESPKVRTYRKQIDHIITNVKNDPSKIKFFEDNLNMLI